MSAEPKESQREGEATMTEPRTEAGRTFTEKWRKTPCWRIESVPDAVLAIEDEAATEARRELLAKVAKVPLYQNAESGVTTTETTTNRLREYRAAVLRLIEERHDR